MYRKEEVLINLVPLKKPMIPESAAIFSCRNGRYSWKCKQEYRGSREFVGASSLKSYAAANKEQFDFIMVNFDLPAAPPEEEEGKTACRKRKKIPPFYPS